ncbi:hypothetical protein ACHWQZ_G002574 [Mnemiopsis leidyi]
MVKERNDKLFLCKLCGFKGNNGKGFPWRNRHSHIKSHKRKDSSLSDFDVERNFVLMDLIGTVSLKDFYRSPQAAPKTHSKDTVQQDKWASEIMSEMELGKVAPLCMDQHWFLTTVQNGKIEVFDSVPGSRNRKCKLRRKHLFSTFAKLLPGCNEVAMEKKKAPHHKNAFDGGIFTLSSAEKLMTDDRITGPDPIRTRSVYFSMLAGMSGRPRLGVLRRFVFGGPGYLNKMTPELIHRFLEEQNPDLGHDFTLDSMTSKVRFHPAGGEKYKSSDHLHVGDLPYGRRPTKMAKNKESLRDPAPSSRNWNRLYP